MLKFKLFYKISFINITSHLSSMLKIFDLLIIAAHHCKSIFSPRSWSPEKFIQTHTTNFGIIWCILTVFIQKKVEDSQVNIYTDYFDQYVLQKFKSYVILTLNIFVVYNLFIWLFNS